MNAIIIEFLDKISSLLPQFVSRAFKTFQLWIKINFLAKAKRLQDNNL